MQYRTLGHTGLRVSALGFGCMRLPVVGGDEARIDDEAAGALLRRAIDLGVNYLDTAYPYHGGDSERFLGRVLGPDLRRRVVVATKMPPWPVRTRADCERILDEQFERLATDRIDLYLLHSLNARHWAMFRSVGVLDLLERARADGRIGHLGFSFHDQLPVFRRIVDAYPWDFCQIQLNYVDEQIQAGVDGLRYAAARGLGVVVMEPLRGGRLARAGGPELERLWATDPLGRSPAEVALRWVWDLPGVSTVLSGMNALDQVEENCRVAAAARTGSLDADGRRLAAEARAWFQTRAVVPCTYCQYCLPCPEGVNIPRILEFHNDAVMFDDWPIIRKRYQRFTPRDEWADRCVRCGRCEEACPQGIAIPDELERAHRALAPGDS